MRYSVVLCMHKPLLLLLYIYAQGITEMKKAVCLMNSGA